MRNDEKVLFYTGLPLPEVLEALYEHVDVHVSRKSQTLTKFQERIMVLVKLRLNVPFRDLAYRFDVSVSSLATSFVSWLTSDCRH